ncbi:MAG: aspartate aminotransferase family protein [Zetaproteobacteria bacterium CG12_big_fil_rev_8_21_14_0_65_54_13]|nr:MAG: aspartate aminotransferase family protein [Zetaproteobacteria bacterium CG23_combo_of_CG06-09_8_20_14_all_54_7]PIW48253.1 MAG: aspartate aminotransferase family protein [Zetaproteobacteria bacterium CG12_big_fil_rev_8_21_14_0_65_54_13]PIX54553.1 MAG: aspartate aminotransferase family protein [Zetaproteobacteria bacterium CG_4_10_14_3_um_filter_54_28]PJA29729.1 MAG: aspartate aminotransferase family protein [Zetaproteobacteria bacterium CG_4_9_14_3_um_filter_54_145]
MNTYARFPITLVRGDGARVWDDAGNAYLDFISGIAVNTLGHAHPQLTAALSRQAGTMLHCSNLFHIPAQQQLAARLTALSGLDRAFFCNSGAEANEAAIKLARKYFYDQGSSRRTIITAHQSFHGRTMLTLTATGQEKVKTGFDPLPPGFRHVALNDIEALRQAVDGSTAAILLEPLQGEGGVNQANSAYLQAVRALCDEHGLLLLLDEVQTGIGRCGTMFAFEQAGIVPDILTLAKGLGGGVPIGAMLAGEEVATAFGPGTHGSTFGGNPLSCTAALTVLDVIDAESLLDNVIQRGRQLQQGLAALQQRFPIMRAIRGQGLLVGAELSIEAAPIVAAARSEGLMILLAGPNVLRFLPPLNIRKEEVNEALALLASAMETQP